MKQILISLAIAFSFYSLHAQHTGNASYGQFQSQVEALPTANTFSSNLPRINSNQYQFEINGLANVVADAYTAIFNVIQLAPSAVEADQIMSSRIQTMEGTLSTLGLEGVSVKIDMVSLVPVYAFQEEKKRFSKKTYQEVPVGLELQKNLLVHFTQADQLDLILKAAAESEIFDLVKVDYYIKDREAVYAELRERCKANLDAKVEFYTSLGIRLDTADRALSFAESVVYPMSRYKEYQAASVSQLSGIKDPQGVQQVRKPQSAYYHALPDHPFDVVINPEIREPVVQFTYSLRVLFTFPPKVTPQIQVKKEIQREREYIILTPDGQTRTLEITKQ